MRWIDIKGYSGKYQLSDTGLIKSFHHCKSGRALKLFLTVDGYPQADLRLNTERKTVRVHRLVAEYFVDNPSDLIEVNHIDGDKENNKFDNLEWVTHAANMQHAFNTGLHSHVGVRNTRCILTECQVREIRVLLQEGKLSCKRIGDMYGVTGHTIYDIRRGKNWRHIC